jgi:hypothetical protein
MDMHLKTASLIANLLDNSISLFGRRFGLNGLLGLIPGAGDIFTAALSMYIVWIGVQMRVPLLKLLEMILNVAINFFIGLVPIIGDAADFFHKGNLKNLRILEDHAKNHVIEGEIVDTSKSAVAR